jgi:pSer/pThr/pTyr-binding forkhead associated (FHA) protein
VGQATDILQIALASTRRAFVTAMPYTFIVSDGTLSRAMGPVRTMPFERIDLTIEDVPTSTASEKPGARTFIALPIRKVIDTFPNMITLGRTANNDLVIGDVSVSKFHAFFTQTPRGLELADAGSKNGTWIGGDELPPRGQPHPVRLGDRLRFGRVGFTVVDPGVCWDTIDRMRR